MILSHPDHRQLVAVTVRNMAVDRFVCIVQPAAGEPIQAFKPVAPPIEVGALTRVISQIRSTRFVCRWLFVDLLEIHLCASPGRLCVLQCRPNSCG